MLGSLIGIFLTSAGIVIGADSAVPGSSWLDPTRVEKACKPSRRSVAVMQGWYGEQLYLARRFHDSCRELTRSSKSISVERQADRLIRKLQKAYKEHIGPLPPNMANLPPPSRRHVSYLAVAGYDGRTPVATVRELRWEKSPDGKWQLITERSDYLSFEQCGAKFVGETTIATMLLDGTEYFDKEKDRPEVLAGRKVNLVSKQGDCASSFFSVQEAKNLYKFVVRMTIDHAGDFLIDNGDVGGRLRVFTIPLSGSIKEELIDPEQYVRDPSSDGGRSVDVTTDVTTSPESGEDEAS
jgi:Proteasome subunit